MVMSPGGRRISWLFFTAVRAGLAVKRPYLDSYGSSQQRVTGWHGGTPFLRLLVLPRLAKIANNPLRTVRGRLSVPLTPVLALGALPRPLDRYDHPFMQSLSRILYHTIRIFP